eukprot:m.42262 g.42262  ORF g.42262 m.42262 type:complete len:310 (+) comp33346_c0_seq3:77-1006(+)
MAKRMRISCQWSKGRHLIGDSLTPGSTFLDLQEELHKATGIPPTRQRILKGYPPERLEGDVLRPLWDFPIQSGDSLIVEETTDNDGTTKTAKTEVKVKSDGQSKQTVAKALKGGVVKRKVISADNSCLFGSISFVLEDHSVSHAAELRHTAADIIASDPHTYNETFLGRPNKEYSDWIRKRNSWGGTPELVVFSNMYEAEINVVNVQNIRIDEFGEDKGYKKRVFITHDGVHFDALYVNRNGKVVTVFSTDENDIKEQVLSLAGDLNDARQYTNLEGGLLCMVCNTLFKGQMQAYKHGQATGHANFKET